MSSCFSEGGWTGAALLVGLFLGGCGSSEPPASTPPNLHRCVASLPGPAGPVQVLGWGSTEAEARRAARIDGRFLAESLLLVDVYGPVLTGGQAGEPRQGTALAVGDCTAAAVPGGRVSVTWPGGETATRGTPAAALSAARRRSCGVAVQASFATGSAEAAADFRRLSLSCWTAPEPPVTAAAGELAGPAAAAGPAVLCDLPHDELRSAALGVGSTRDDALEAALRSRALGHVLRGQANAAGALSAEAPRRVALAATGFGLASGFVVAHPELEQAAAHCAVLAAGTSVGRLQLDDRDFLASCTPPSTLPPAVGGLEELPEAIDALCEGARTAHLERRRAEGGAVHAAWSEAALCAAWCRARVQLPEARLGADGAGSRARP